jgi:peptidoglycan/xylan/chitin deacetylase (PgdA/CDA1 family)
VSATASAPRIRKILCSGALAISLAAFVAAGASGQPPQQDLVAAKLSQAGMDLVFTVQTATPVPLSQLQPQPRPRSADARYLCLSMRRKGHQGERLLCLGGRRAHHSLGLELLNAQGAVTRKEALPARVRRPKPLELVVSLVPGRAGLRPHRYAWRTIEGRGPCGAPPCLEQLPAKGTEAFRLRPVRVVGCSGGTTGLVNNGPRNRKVVALTFDDGPSIYTPGFLSVLRRDHVPGTFFEIGSQVAAYPSYSRRVLADGEEIGNHTMNHEFYPGYSNLAATNALIRARTHFEPCLFRPPGGALNSSVVAAAGEAGLRTIVWDVDPMDWSLPGSGAIYSRIVDSTRPGSIILMHDGGGNRSETLAALPSIIQTLRGRGYRFETVTQLLGGRMIYRPYG